ncbi:COX assembly mitochondrial protein homolog [Pectinophora gossypiella]|uniref:COX assembly mitochondrial protein n=1 Tax=Pectinophora gossypiella TaxID=13191 RepID=A0A1E1WTM3_PECGO|nr:COX assembly mitochondrial protein homolog [Pectinophora gossypiella]XP_049875741.1 COX assembly mitochondrial protein homolog [Pectinophora gossypiella]
MSNEKTVLSKKLSEGPHGLGDPDDRTLRKVEVEVLIPKLMRDKAKKEKCTKEVAEFENCCKSSSLMMVISCREQNSVLKDCLSNWYKNDAFRNLCTEEYLKERSEFRRTGVKKPIKRA